MIKPEELNQLFKMMEHNQQQYERMKDYPGTVQQTAFALSNIEDMKERIRKDYTELYELANPNMDLSGIEHKLFKEIDRVQEETNKEPYCIYLASDVCKYLVGKSIADIKSHTHYFTGIKIYENESLLHGQFIVVPREY